MEKVNKDDIPEDGAQPLGTSTHEPIFNLPKIIIVFSCLIIAVHFVRDYLLTVPQDNQLVYFLAFFPASYGHPAVSGSLTMSGLWSPVTHAFLHGDWVHVAMNLIWMAAFGSPVAKRFGLWRFIILAVLCSAGGALLHYLTATNPYIPIIGASGAVSGFMGAASRFVFQNMSSGMRFNPEGKAMSLMQCFQNKQFLVFFAMWMGINYLFGAGFTDVTGEEALIAWQAHIGGFITGLLAFSLLDPVQKASAT